ncbi:JmjC domain-containing protein [Cystobacter ferrugineus]|uniref:JmjC domain-containing protein n=1 Tax=Cystobacter ferrugineus TaxID=83449 RepID=A0A1L9B752_9BACT|nr:cupin domain-containing protein [Cystobacter ferrugineus]OJH38043.1 hypothetical protein BON30_23020 [Cystobacter ferrugineus]
MSPCEDFQSVISPTPVERFASLYWEKKALHISRGTPGYFGSLFSVEQLDRLINVSFTNLGLFMFEGERVITPRLRRPTKTTLSEFYKEFASGKSICLRDMQVRWKPITQLVSAVARESGFSVTAELVATPPRSRNAGIFADSRSLIVLQLEGAATWHLPAGRFQPLASAQEGTSPENQEHAGAVSLRPGDTLYLPYGNAPGTGASGAAALPMVETGDGHALHLVLTIQRVTWADLLARTVAVASGKNVELRRALGFGGPLSVSGRGQMESRFRELVAQAFDSPSWKEANHLLASEHSRRLPILSDGHFDLLRHVDSVGLETEVIRRPGVEGRVQLYDGVVELIFPGYYYQAPEKVYLALDFISETRQFKVKDIPGWYTDQERIALTRQLISMGVLTFVTPPGSAPTPG